MIGRRTARISLIFLAVALALDTAAWFAATSTLRRGLADWQHAAAAHGVTLDLAASHRGGWPWAARLVAAQPVLRAAGASWSAARLVLSLTPLHGRSLSVSIQGPEVLAQTGMAPIGVQPRAMHLLIPLDPGMPVSLHATDLALRVPASAEAETGRIGRLEASIVSPPNAPARLAYTLEAGDFSARAMVRGGDRLRLEGTIDTPALPEGTLASQAQAWRAAGGRITAALVSLGWGPLAVQGSAELHLDASLQPDLGARLHVSGYGQALDALDRAGALSHGQAVASRTALALLAGLRPDLILGITVAGGTVSVAGIPVARVPALRWPGGSQLPPRDD